MGASITPKGTGLYDLYNLWTTVTDLFKQYTRAPPAQQASAPTGWVSQDSQNTQSQLIFSQLPTINVDPCASVAKPGVFASDQYVYKLAECCKGRNPPGATCSAFAKSWEAAKMTLPDGYQLGDLAYIDSIVAGINANGSGMLSVLSVGSNDQAMRAAVNTVMQARVRSVLGEMYPSSAQKLRLGTLTTKQVAQPVSTIRLGNLSVPESSGVQSSGILNLFNPSQAARIVTNMITFKKV
ncbi:hypothetical protein M0R72_05785 [Candidatus Pacearchaeota archaeon]|jgi:hypothetical protein|nr:hypothetical protein [Candidatus Pacearchaeota archaeon]